MDFWRGWPFPVAVAVLFGIVLTRAGGTYAIGRAADAGARRTRLTRLMARPRFGKVHALVSRWGAPVVALSFLTVGLQTLVNLAAGLARMPLRRYLPALIVGSVMWALLYATVGFAGFTAWRRLYTLSPVGAVIGLLLLLIAVAGYLVRAFRHRKDEGPDEAPAVTVHIEED